MNTIPKEDCTKEEAIEFLTNHIKDLDAQLAAKEERFAVFADEKQQRAWAIDIASRFFEKAVVPNFNDVKAFADNICGYAGAGNQDEASQ